ncbi:MAG: 30S ribosomal protein S9 [Parcubacteria group bacterium]|nr:30S ribosomal protein S9 [Parcubacteria group bacterium]|tara:strand:- start:12971 stop:13510 length:540 start_codon:yes stop_codon:yes gene_type:complete
MPITKKTATAEKKSEQKTIKKPTAKKTVKKSEKKVTTKDTDDDEPKKRVRHSYLFAVGRRKKAVARVRLFKKGNGEILVNDKQIKEYFPTFELREIVVEPLEKIGAIKDFNFSIKVRGGGSRGQAEAVRHGIARSLVVYDKDLRTTLKPYGFLKRDPRRKERKKPGLKRARRAPQWAKR